MLVIITVPLMSMRSSFSMPLELSASLAKASSTSGNLDLSLMSKLRDGSTFGISNSSESLSAISFDCRLPDPLSCSINLQTSPVRVGPHN
jgi:hypothetical protein